MGKAGAVGVTALLTKSLTTKLLAKSGVKFTAKAGSFWYGASTGVTVCAPSGPWALACGAAAGALTWVGVDFAISKADEAITREVFEAKLRAEIERVEAQYKQAMKGVFAKGIDSTYHMLETKIYARPIDVVDKHGSGQ